MFNMYIVDFTLLIAHCTTCTLYNIEDRNQIHSIKVDNILFTQKKPTSRALLIINKLILSASIRK